jgi:hypothetical protein
VNDTHIVNPDAYISELVGSLRLGVYPDKYAGLEIFDIFGELWDPCERSGDGVRPFENSERLLDSISGDGCGDIVYGLLVERSRRICALESLRATSRWRFNSLCSGVRAGRGGLDEIDRAYIGMSFESKPGVRVPAVIGGLICWDRN